MPQEFQLDDLAIVALGAFVIGALVAAYLVNLINRRSMLDYVLALGKQYEKKISDLKTKAKKDIGNETARYLLEKEENERLVKTFDLRVDKEVRRKLAEWEPNHADIDSDFARAERMAERLANRRDEINTGRSHPPRSDGGEHATVSRVTFRR